MSLLFTIINFCVCRFTLLYYNGLYFICTKLILWQCQFRVQFVQIKGANTSLKQDETQGVGRGSAMNHISQPLAILKSFCKSNTRHGRVCNITKYECITTGSYSSLGLLSILSHQLVLRPDLSISYLTSKQYKKLRQYSSPKI